VDLVLADTVKAKFQQLHKEGVVVNQMTLELMAQLSEEAAISCITEALTAKGDKLAVFKSSIDKSLSHSEVVMHNSAETAPPNAEAYAEESMEPPQKKVKTEEE
jgi:hypothetical protein